MYFCSGLHANDFSNGISVFGSAYLVNDFTNETIEYRRNNVGKMT